MRWNVKVLLPCAVLALTAARAQEPTPTMDPMPSPTPLVRYEPGNPLQVGSPMPGLVVRVLAGPGERVAAGQKLFTLEAMKMETTIQADRAGLIAEVAVQPGAQVEAGDLLLRYSE